LYYEVGFPLGETGGAFAAATSLKTGMIPVAESEFGKYRPIQDKRFYLPFSIIR
jgi:hypothetical protein